MVVQRIAISVDEVVPVDVIDVAVAVVVDPVAWDLSRVYPHVRSQVRMRVVDAGIDDGDHHRAAARVGVPGLIGVNVGARRASELAGVVKSPQVGEVRVVGNGLRGLVDGEDVVRLHDLDLGAARHLPPDRVEVLVGLELQPAPSVDGRAGHPSRPVEAPDLARTERAGELVGNRGIDLAPELHQERVGAVRALAPLPLDVRGRGGNGGAARERESSHDGRKGCDRTTRVFHTALTWPVSRGWLATEGCSTTTRARSAYTRVTVSSAVTAAATPGVDGGSHRRPVAPRRPAPDCPSTVPLPSLPRPSTRGTQQTTSAFSASSGPSRGLRPRLPWLRR